MSVPAADALSAALFARARQRIPGGVNSPVRSFRSVGGAPFFTAKAHGARLTTVDGRELIDFVGTWGPAILGHAHPKVSAAVSAALADGTSFGTSHPREIDMAERICAQVPGVEMVRLVNSGTEATMSAIRLARGATGRARILKFDGCYHGHVDSLLVAAGSGALTLGSPDSAGVPADLAALTHVLPFNDRDALDELFTHWGHELACVIVEPFPANTGLLLPHPGYLQHLRDLCERHQVVLIFDEVMTGFRLAPGGVSELTGVTADLVCLGKVIGGGLPVGAFGGRRDLMEQLAPLGPVYQAGTLSGNPLALAAGLAQLDELAATDAYARLESLGQRLESGLRALLDQHGLPWQLHRAGSMWTLFFTEAPVHHSAAVQQSDHQRFARFFQGSLGAGIFLPPSPYEAAFLSTAHTEADIDFCLEAWSRLLPEA